MGDSFDGAFPRTAPGPNSFGRTYDDIYNKETRNGYNNIDCVVIGELDVVVRGYCVMISMLLT